MRMRRERKVVSIPCISNLDADVYVLDWVISWLIVEDFFEVIAYIQSNCSTL